MKLGFFEIEGWEEKIIRAEFPNDDVFVTSEKLDFQSPPQIRDFDGISIFIDSKITKEALSLFQNLKFITTRTTGFDHVDLVSCAEKGISVAYVPGYGDNTVAEFAFGLLLNLTRKIYQAIDRVKETGSFSLAGLRGMDIKGKTIGIIGTGRIGKEMIKIAKGFEMEIVAFDPSPDLQFASEMKFGYLELDELLKTADIISIHCPYNKDAHHLINRENIKLIKNGAYIINTARGPIMETQALIDALEDGILAGAGLDVLEEEGETKDELSFLKSEHPREEEMRVLLENHVLMHLPNVLITPHNAFNSTEALERILRTTIHNIQGFFGGRPINLVMINENRIKNNG